MPKINWTDGQRDAIEARGGSLLVSAAAGSGKTAVLSERVIRRVTDSEASVDIDRMLIVTYTRAAAEQMKDKISGKLQRLLEPRNLDPDLEQDGAPPPDRALLRRQQLLLGKAHISTIHSFCYDLIRQNAQKLGLAPESAIADERELQSLRDEALKACAEEFYRGERGAAFTELADLISSGRDDRSLFETVYRLYDFIRSHPFYEDWLAEKLAVYNVDAEVCETQWGKILLEYAADSLRCCMELIDEVLALCAGNDAMKKAYESAYRTDFERIRAVLELIQAPRLNSAAWDTIRAGLPAELTPFTGAVRGEKENPQKQRADAIRKELKSILQKLRERVFSASSVEFLEDIGDLRPKIELLFALTLSFSQRLDELKRERRLLDFSDLEQFALKLLYEEQSGGHTRSALAEELSRGFEEIMIDEYQDTNEAQNMIFSAVARCEGGEPQNLFLVGDVKQSIYRFRQAMPEIFIAKKEAFAPYGGGFPAKINLGANFRSRAGVTDFVNFLFRQLMSKELGELDYNDEEALQPRAAYPETDEISAELQIIDLSQNSAEEAKLVLEARYVARRIAEMLTEGFCVADGDGGMRPARQSDFCVLLRSKKDKLGVFVKELRANGVNAWAEAQGGYLAAREISVMLSFLRVLDNPLLEIPLVSVMLSELFAFTPDEVAAVRLRDRKKPLYLCVCEAAGEGEPKCTALAESIRRYSAAAVTVPIDRLLLRIYRETDYLPIVSAMPMGENRKANLRLLAEYAAGYDRGGHKGLCGFVRFIDRVLECGSDFPPASTMSENADVVRVMTIHHSKGLEFPVVFLSDTAKQHNSADYVMARTILHPKYGFACRRRDAALMKEYTTLPMEALKLECERSALSEELRVLYVALTRAKEKLIVTMTQERLPAKLRELSGGVKPGEKLPPFLVRKCKSFADWVLLCALRHPDGVNLRAIAGAEDDRVLQAGFRLTVGITPPQEAVGEAPAEELTLASEPREELVEQIAARAAFVYPHAAACRIPAKLGVSAIAHKSGEAAHRFSRTPHFLAKRELTGAQRGSALHQFMQFADYEAAHKNAAAELERVAKLGFISEVQRACIDVKRVETFFRSPLYGRIAAAGEVRRELRFLSQLPADEIGYAGAEESDAVTVQGVADCVFFEDGAYVIVDYKTDAVQTTQELAQRYAPQLALYKEIIEKSLRLPVKECVLYSFALGKAVAV